jgi:hypothetical protein
MSTACQRQPADDNDEQLEHASMVAAVAAKFNRNEFWRGSAWIAVAPGDAMADFERGQLSWPGVGSSAFSNYAAWSVCTS